MGGSLHDSDGVNRVRAHDPQVAAKPWALALASLLLQACGWCVGSHTAVETLESHGYKDVRILGKQVVMLEQLGCASDDDVRFIAVAAAPNGDVRKVFLCLSTVPARSTVGRFIW